jgi:DNA-directed RNA polymerase subunit RPC12/RpoP
MAISLSCASCGHKLRVKDEHAGRKIKCPECSKIFRVPEAREVEEEEIPVPKRPAGREDGEEAPRKRPPPIMEDDEDDEEVPPPKKKKGILSTDINDLHARFNNFDVRRFTLAGWLLLVVAVAIGLTCLLLVEKNYDRIMGPPEPNTNIQIRYYAPMSIAAAVGGLGTFFIGVGVLRLLGIKAIRPKPNDTPDED